MTAKFHHMLPPMSTGHRGFIVPWTKKNEAGAAMLKDADALPGKHEKI